MILPLIGLSLRCGVFAAVLVYSQSESAIYHLSHLCVVFHAHFAGPTAVVANHFSDAPSGGRRVAQIMTAQVLEIS